MTDSFLFAWFHLHGVLIIKYRNALQYGFFFFVQFHFWWGTTPRRKKAVALIQECQLRGFTVPQIFGVP